jgi:hypothetical protein
MSSPSNNLFLRLHKWATRQDENYLTESLSVVLEQLLVLVPAVGTRLIARLTGGFISLPPENASAIELQTQLETGHGRPDLDIRSPNKIVWIEVKAESELRAGQLAGYRVLLERSEVEERRLVLLTRYPEVFEEDDVQPDFAVRWYELADWFQEELLAADNSSEIAGFLVRQFLNFLGARNMSLAQVGKYMPEGLRALSNLMNMLVEAASACKVTSKKSAGWDNIGLTLDGLRYWVGVNFSEPEKLWFGTRGQIDPEAAAKLGVGELGEENWIQGRYRWWRGVELDSEPVHFFSRSKVSQIQWLEGFLNECLSQARSIEVPDQSSLPSETEEV